jgi:AbrB family looped-hinge helix DNA binding protein
MEIVRISSKFQVVIPKAICTRLKLVAGQRMQAIAYDDRIELIAVRPIKRMRGFLKGIDTSIADEAERI